MYFHAWGATACVVNRIKVFLGFFALSLAPFGGAEAKTGFFAPSAVAIDYWAESIPPPVGIWYALDMAGIDIIELIGGIQEDSPQSVSDTAQKNPNRQQDLQGEMVQNQEKIIEKPLSVKKTAAQKTVTNNPSKADVRKVTVTAYSSTVDQTDSTPCITANGFNVCEHNKENIIAANFLPFGTRVRMPGLYGDKIFTVQDRMNRRYAYRVDIWMKTREKAKNFGVKYTSLEIVSEQLAMTE